MRFRLLDSRQSLKPDKLIRGFFMSLTTYILLNFGILLRPLLLVMILMMGACSTVPPARIYAPDSSQKQVVISDIDGTVTPRNYRICTARAAAAEALTALSKKGYQIVYLTARSPLFQTGLQGFLDKNGFPKGSLHAAQTIKDNKKPDQFKSHILSQYIDSGWQLEYAYGDSDTDFIAYAKANIPKEQVFALKREGSESCDEGAYKECLKGWEEHLPYIDKVVPNAN